MDFEDKQYTLSEESLKKLLSQSYRSGVLGAYQTLFDSIEANIKPEQFPNEDMSTGFDYCKNLIYAMINKASETLDSKDTDV